MLLLAISLQAHADTDKNARPRANPHPSEPTSWTNDANPHPSEPTSWTNDDSSKTAQAVFGGVVRARQRAVLSAELDSTIVSMPFQEGEIFNEGDLLVAMDCTLADAAHDQAKARFAVAAQDQASNKKLARMNSVSDLELAESAARLATSSAELVASTYRQERCTVVAPFNGVVLRHGVRPHERVQSGHELLEIASSDAHTIEFLMPAEKSTTVSIGQSFTFDNADSQHILVGKIIHLIPDVDPVSRTFKVIGQLDSPPLAAAIPSTDGADDNAENGRSNSHTNQHQPPLWPGMSGWVTPQ